MLGHDLVQDGLLGLMALVCKRGTPASVRSDRLLARRLLNPSFHRVAESQIREAVASVVPWSLWPVLSAIVTSLGRRRRQLAMAMARY